MQGYKLSTGFLIDFSDRERKQTLECLGSDHLKGTIKKYRGQFDEDIEKNFKELGNFLTSFRKNLKHPSMNSFEFSPLVQNRGILREIFDLDVLNPKDVFNYVKAIIAFEGSGKSYLANTRSNFFVRTNNFLDWQGIFEGNDTIALYEKNKQRFQSYRESLEFQKKSEALFFNLKVKENLVDYYRGNFINLPFE